MLPEDYARCMQVAHTASLPLSEGRLCQTLQAYILLLLKQPNLDKEQMANY